MSCQAGFALVWLSSISKQIKLQMDVGPGIVTDQALSIVWSS
jgi:hypothetical protein